ncbi:MAG: hypothetical protein ACYTFT_17720 [Planctomycetota bacterium]|jgi:hypothetical protein
MIKRKRTQALMVFLLTLVVGGLVCSPTLAKGDSDSDSDSDSGPKDDKKCCRKLEQRLIELEARLAALEQDSGGGGGLPAECEDKLVQICEAVSFEGDHMFIESQSLTIDVEHQLDLGRGAGTVSLGTDATFIHVGNSTGGSNNESGPHVSIGDNADSAGFGNGAREVSFAEGAGGSSARTGFVHVGNNTGGLLIGEGAQGMAIGLNVKGDMNIGENLEGNIQIGLKPSQ